MTQTAIAADLHQALHVLRNLAMQVAFDLEVLLDVVAQLREVFLGKVLHANVGIDAGSGDDLFGRSEANARKCRSRRSQCAYCGEDRHQRDVPCLFRVLSS